MRQWLTILAIIWTTAAIQAAGEGVSTPRPIEIRTSVLSQQDHANTEEIRVPLLATPSPNTQQFCGTEQTTGKGSRQSETLTAILRANHLGFHIRASVPATSGHNICPPNIRTGKRYIYFLRRIII